MSDLAAPLAKKTSAAIDIRSIVASVVFVASLLLVWITLDPFPNLSIVQQQLDRPTDVLYHITALFLVGLGILVAFPRLCETVPSLIRTFNVLLLMWMLVSVATSANADVSARRLYVILMDAALAIVVLSIPRGLENFARLSMVAVSSVLLLCYAGLMLVPRLSIHQFTDAFEFDLDGDWRGSFLHKNTAGPMMAVFILFGIFFARAGRPLGGATVALAAALFLVMTRSKNAILLFPLTLVLAGLAERTSSLWRRLAICLLPLVFLNVLAVGSSFWQPLGRIVELLPIDATFTGRTDIWSFVAERIAERPLTGYGLRAFWHSETVLATVLPGGEWLGDIANSHNGYLDIALMIGLPGLALMLIVFLVYPLIDFHNQRKEPRNELIASLFLRIWLFEMYTSTFESFVFDRAFPGWFTTMMAVFGLRYAARLQVAR